MARSFSFISCTFVFCVTLFVSEGCRCKQPTVQLTCNADYVMKAFVKRLDSSVGGTNSWDQAYTISILDIFKFENADVTKMDLVHLFTTKSSASCGLSLKPGIYLLSGSVDTSVTPHRFKANTCTFNKKWTRVTPFEKTFVQNPFCSH